MKSRLSMLRLHCPSKENVWSNCEFSVKFSEVSFLSSIEAKGDIDDTGLIREFATLILHL